MSRDVAALSNLIVPTGLRVGSRHFIPERLPNPDSPGAWALAINSLLEHTKPPLLIDGWSEPLTSGAAAGVYDEVATWMLPWEYTATGTALGGEVVQAQALVRVLNGDTARLRLKTSAGNFETGDIAAGGWAWVDFGDIEVEDEADWEMTLLARAASDGDNVEVAGIWARWDSSRTELPAGAEFLSGFEPFDMARLTDALKGLSVRTLRQIVANLQRLRRRRIPSMIATKAWPESAAYIPGAIADLEGGGTTFRTGGFRGAMRALTRQHKGFRRARVWLRGEVAPSVTGTARIDFRSETGLIAQTQFAVGVTTPTWYVADVELPAYTGQQPLPVAMDVVLPESGGSMSVYGVNAWWLPIT